MQRVEKIYLVVITLAILLRLFNIPGAGGLLTLSMMTFSLFYLGLSTFLFNGLSLEDISKGFSKTAISIKRVLGSVIIGLSLSTLVLGVLFKIMLWPGAIGMLFFGTRLAFVPLIICIIKYFPERNIFYLNAIKRVSVALIIGLFLFYLPNEYLWNVYYKDFPEHIETLKKLRQNPNDPELNEAVKFQREEMIRKRSGRNNQSE